MFWRDFVRLAVPFTASQAFIACLALFVGKFLVGNFTLYFVLVGGLLAFTVLVLWVFRRKEHD